MSSESDKRDENATAVGESDAPQSAVDELVREEQGAPRPIRAAEGDPDDETWTNQPAGARSGGADDEEDEYAASDEAEDRDDEEDEDHAPAPRKPIQNGHDVLTEELPMRASRAKMRLHSYLKAALVVEFADSGTRYLFDWRGEEPKVTNFEKKGPIEVSDAATTSTGIDAVISLTEQNLMAVRSGDLNPQVAMIADKIKVRGKMSPAVYLFNLIAPRVRD